MHYKMKAGNANQFFKISALLLVSNYVGDLTTIPNGYELLIVDKDVRGVWRVRAVLEIEVSAVEQ